MHASFKMLALTSSSGTYAIFVLIPFSLSRMYFVYLYRCAHRESSGAKQDNTAQKFLSVTLIRHDDTIKSLSYPLLLLSY